MNPFTDLFTPLIIVTISAALLTMAFSWSNLIGWPSWLSKQPLSQHGLPSLSKLSPLSPPHMHVYVYLTLLSCLVPLSQSKQTCSRAIHSSHPNRHTVSHATHSGPNALHCGWSAETSIIPKLIQHLSHIYMFANILWQRYHCQNKIS